MLLDVLRYPDARLKRMSEAVTDITDHTRKLCDDLSETMLERDGVGLAAPQVGELVRIFVLNDNGPRIFINPTIVYLSTEEIEDTEGCLSFPGVFLKVKRSATAAVEATDVDGNKFGVTYNGLLARAAQHEMDHLNGKLLSDRMTYLKRQMVTKKLQKFDRW